MYDYVHDAMPGLPLHRSRDDEPAVTGPTDRVLREWMSPTDTGPPPGIPLWVKVFVLAVVVLGLLVVVGMIAIGGNHGPGSHAPGTITSFAILVTRNDARRLVREATR